VALTHNGTRFSGEVVVDYSVVQTGDDTLQARLQGDQFTAVYTDSVFTSDVATGYTNYAPKTVNPPTSIPASGTRARLVIRG